MDQFKEDVEASIKDLREYEDPARSLNSEEEEAKEPRRYWKYGYLWKIELSVGDTMRDGILPTTYLLHSGPIVGEDAYMQAESLIENMNHHLNHVNFLNGYGFSIVFI